MLTHITQHWSARGLSLWLSILLTLPLAILLPSTPAFAADTGFMSPAVTGTNHADWSTPANAFASDDAYATETSEGEDQSYENFGFSVPVGSLIHGVEMNVEAKSADTSGCRIEAQVFSASDNSHGSFQNSSSVTGSDAVYTLGSSSTLWGSTWLASDFDNANFHAQVQFDDVPSSSCGATTFSIDHVRVKVYYTPPVENPPLAEACGLDMALVIDSSGSINSTELATMKTAFNGFIDTFLPATPTEMAVVEFDSTASVTQGFTDDATLLHTAINAAVSGGSTNWDDALFDAHSLFPNRADKPDVIVFASDGNPTASDGPLSHLEDAIVEANAAKTDGIHIIALGIGSDLDVNSLFALSTPDSVITSAFDTLAADLAELAEELCGGTITVHKVVDADGNLNTTGDQTDGAGWTFNTNVDSPDSATPSSGDTDGDGLINFDIDLGDDDTATVDIVETPEAGYALLSASCTKQGNGAVGTAGLSMVSNITLGKADIVSCVFYNVPAGRIIIEKQTEPDGDATLFEFDPSYGATFSLSDGQENNSGFILAPGAYSIAEVSQSGWQLTNVTCSDGSLPDAINVSAGETVTCVFTNTIDELCKDVGDDIVINENQAYVINSVDSSANSGSNSANGGNGGSAGNGGSVAGSDNDDNTTGAGGTGGNGGGGGTITTGNAGTGTIIDNSVNYNNVSIDRCGCGCGGCGDDVVVNGNLGVLFNGTGSASNSGTNNTDGSSNGSSGNGGSVAGSDNDDNTTGAGGFSADGGTGGTVRTGAAVSLTGISNSINTNVTRIRR